jgi:RNA-binding protein YlmH
MCLRVAWWTCTDVSEKFVSSVVKSLGDITSKSRRHRVFKVSDTSCQSLGDIMSSKSRRHYVVKVSETSCQSLGDIVSSKSRIHHIIKVSETCQSLGELCRQSLGDIISKSRRHVVKVSETLCRQSLGHIMSSKSRRHHAVKVSETSINACKTAWLISEET